METIDGTIASLANLYQAEAQTGLEAMQLTENSVAVYLGTRCVFLGIIRAQ